MPLWSFPGVVTAIRAPYVCAVLDLGVRLYANTAIRVAGLTADAGTITALEDLLPAGTRILAATTPLPGGPIRAHLTLEDGRDVATIIRGRRAPKAVRPQYGGGLAKTWTYPATLEKIVDGDTVHAALDTGSPLTYRAAVRVAHVNAPEKTTPEGQAALVWAERVLTPGLQVTITSHELDKYGRLLATVLTPDSHDFGTELIAAGHAVPYEGGPR